MRRDALISIAVAIPVLTMAAYIAGYFVFSEQSTAYKFEDTIRTRWFATEGLAQFYEPAVRIEAFITGWDVSARLASEGLPSPTSAADSELGH